MFSMWPRPTKISPIAFFPIPWYELLFLEQVLTCKYFNSTSERLRRNYSSILIILCCTLIPSKLLSNWYHSDLVRQFTARTAPLLSRITVNNRVARNFCLFPNAGWQFLVFAFYAGIRTTQSAAVFLDETIFPTDKSDNAPSIALLSVPSKRSCWWHD